MITCTSDLLPCDPLVISQCSIRGRLVGHLSLDVCTWYLECTCLTECVCVMYLSLWCGCCGDEDMWVLSWRRWCFIACGPQIKGPCKEKTTQCLGFHFKGRLWDEGMRAYLLVRNSELWLAGLGGRGHVSSSELCCGWLTWEGGGHVGSSELCCGWLSGFNICELL